MICSGSHASAQTGQMTIFYAGKVMVFDEFPAAKAEEIMMLARKSSAAFAPPSPAESAASTPACLHTSALAFGESVFQIFLNVFHKQHEWTLILNF